MPHRLRESSPEDATSEVSRYSITAPVGGSLPPQSQHPHGFLLQSMWFMRLFHVLWHAVRGNLSRPPHFYLRSSLLHLASESSCIMTFVSLAEKGGVSFVGAMSRTIRCWKQSQHKRGQHSESVGSGRWWGSQGGEVDLGRLVGQDPVLRVEVPHLSARERGILGKEERIGWRGGEGGQEEEEEEGLWSGVIVTRDALPLLFRCLTPAGFPRVDLISTRSKRECQRQPPLCATVCHKLITQPSSCPARTRPLH